VFLKKEGASLTSPSSVSSTGHEFLSLSSVPLSLSLSWLLTHPLRTLSPSAGALSYNHFLQGAWPGPCSTVSVFLQAPLSWRSHATA
jgi:hypothetical protein